MNAETLRIIDTAVLYSLLVFLVSFALLLIYSVWSWHKRARTLAESRLQEIEPSGGETPTGVSGPPRRPPYVPVQNRLRTALRSLLVSQGVAWVCFVTLCFVPLPFLHNFATGGDWQRVPLRLTLLRYERTYEGFSLQGEVWNQMPEPIDSLQAVVTIVDRNGDRVDRLTIPVTPQPLEAGEAGRFECSYAKKSPFLSGYQIAFTRGDLSALPYVEGFDVP
ncbi:MAG: FxLYD domain-containing protein [Acidobacteriota bacterium]